MTDTGATFTRVLHGPRSDTPGAQVGRFTWHYVQMVIAMGVGMWPFAGICDALGRPNLSSDSPNAYAIWMTLAMLVPMIGWMRVLGHSWERTAEMSAAMGVPVVIAVAGSVAGVLPDNAAINAMDVFMFAGMFLAMAFRWSEYAGSCHDRRDAAGARA